MSKRSKQKSKTSLTNQETKVSEQETLSEKEYEEMLKQLEANAAVPEEEIVDSHMSIDDLMGTESESESIVAPDTEGPEIKEEVVVEVKEELTIDQMIRQAEEATNIQPEIVGAVVTPQAVSRPKEVIDETKKPTKKSLNIKFRIESFVENLESKKAEYCKEWAQYAGHHFIGFSSVDGEPMFVEKV